MPENPDDIDRRVRCKVYDLTLQRGTPPLLQTVAVALELNQQTVANSFARLAAGHVLVLQPQSGEILMASPFSAVPTPFPVSVAGISAYGNCIWDALGIPAMLAADAFIESSCGDCGTAMSIRVAGGLVSGEGLLHFAIPARAWWNDLVFT